MSASLNALEERERERTGIKGLKVKYASAFGYAIEISKSNLAMVPSDYVRKQTLTSGERFVIPVKAEFRRRVPGVHHWRRPDHLRRLLAQPPRRRFLKALKITLNEEK